MYFYELLLDIVAEFIIGKFSSNRTDFGVAAAKSFDSNSREDKELLSDISRLATMYEKRRQSKFISLPSIIIRHSG
jgi:hypothetical protein